MLLLKRVTGFALCGKCAEHGTESIHYVSPVYTDNLHHPLTTLLIQIIAVLLMVRLFGYLFSLIGQPGVIGEIVAGIVLGPSVLGFSFRMLFISFFPAHSLTNLELLSQD